MKPNLRIIHGGRDTVPHYQLVDAHETEARITWSAKTLRADAPEVLALADGPAHVRASCIPELREWHGWCPLLLPHYIGPMWGGWKDGAPVWRYESPLTYRLLSD